MRSFNITKAVIFFWILILTAPLAYSQEYKPTKEERKALKKASYNANFYARDTLLVVRKYVLQADYLQNKIGDMVPVSNTLNFVRVDGEKAVLQTGSDFRVGYNGVGGVTAEGNISNYEIHRSIKSFTHKVSFTIMSSIGIYNIDMTILADNSASARITGTTSGSLTWKGNLAALYNARIFKGPNTY